MRLLIACQTCKRQYDASQLAIGQQFRCHCGLVLMVREPRGHDAAVVCCAHCGGPRNEGSLKCEFCGADFTLHERDLETVCPHCFTRVSNQARFCHFCGSGINPEMVAGQESKVACPVCGPERMLASRAWGSVSVMECNRCAGLWLASNSFRQLTDLASTAATQLETRISPKQARPPQVESPPPDGGRRYRPCVTCSQLMQKLNYGRSGVVVDWCAHHGVWFDADELPRIMDWIRAGGLARQKQEEATEAALAESLRRRQGPPQTGAMLSSGTSDYSSSGSIFEILLDGLSGFFFRI